MSNVIGYARVSTREQNPQTQVSELEAAGAGRVFVDHGESSRSKNRPQWLACLDYIREGDVLVVQRLDRLAGTTTLAIETINDLHERGVHIKSLHEPDIDTTTPMGRALFGIVAVFAQLRVDTIRENTRLGLERARKEGKRLGRPPVMTAARIVQARWMQKDGDGVRAIAATLGVSKTSVSRALAAEQSEDLWLSRHECGSSGGSFVGEVEFDRPAGEHHQGQCGGG